MVVSFLVSCVSFVAGGGKGVVLTSGTLLRREFKGDLVLGGHVGIHHIRKGHLKGLLVSNPEREGGSLHLSLSPVPALHSQLNLLDLQIVMGLKELLQRVIILFTQKEKKKKEEKKREY